MRRLVSCYFDGLGINWPRMARVLAYTAGLHCPGWQLALTQLAPPVRRFTENTNHLANTAKLAHWCDAVSAAADGDELLLIDADTFIVRPLDDLWESPFDVAYTVRPPGYPMPLNAGVIFLRASPTTQRFMVAWRERNQQMLRDRALLARWWKYRGINQAALGSLLEEEGGELGHLLPLPCREWNCEDSSWESFAPDVTRIVHVKAALRRAVFPPVPRANTSHLGALATRWRTLEAESTRCE